MRSDVLSFDALHTDPTPALLQVEKCATYCELTAKQALQLRLLAEEMLGLTRAVLGECRAEFWVEGQDKAMKLVTVAHAQVSEDEREQLLQVSTSGENEATRDVMGKIRRIIEVGLYGDGSLQNQLLANAMIGGYQCEDCYAMGAAWSLAQYMDWARDRKAQQPEAWDELEKSIVAKLADEVTVSIKVREATITIIKQF